jgi:hypothetical protein
VVPVQVREDDLGDRGRVDLPMDGLVELLGGSSETPHAALGVGSLGVLNHRYLAYEVVLPHMYLLIRRGSTRFLRISGRRGELHHGPAGASDPHRPLAGGLLRSQDEGSRTDRARVFVIGRHDGADSSVGLRVPTRAVKRTQQAKPSWRSRPRSLSAASEHRRADGAGALRIHTGPCGSRGKASRSPPPRS